MTDDPAHAGPADWGRPLYLRVLEAAGVRSGARLVDVGCGAGRLCRLAADHGARVTGFDSDPARLVQAASLVPEAEFCRADLLALPLASGTAGSVSCVQVLMRVPNPVAALRELGRVVRPGATVVVTVWGPPEQCALGAFGAALTPILGRPPWLAENRPPPGAAPPLSAPGRLARLVGLAGLIEARCEDVRCVFSYPNEQALLAGLYAAEVGQRAVALAGRRAVRRAVLAGLADYQEPDGGYRLENAFRLVAARRREEREPGLSVTR